MLFETSHTVFKQHTVSLRLKRMARSDITFLIAGVCAPQGTNFNFPCRKIMVAIYSYFIVRLIRLFTAVFTLLKNMNPDDELIRSFAQF